PEGIMNCNVRAFKERGVYDTMEEAKDAVAKLEKKDKYFKIFIGEVGKWLDFDPPESRVDKVMTSNKEYQKILDAQKQREVDKKEGGKKERIEESKKAGAASDAVEKHMNKKKEAVEKEALEEEKRREIHMNPRAKALAKKKEKMKKRAAELQNKQTNNESTN